MGVLEIRVSTPIGVLLVVLGLPASIPLLCLGLECLADPANPDGGATL
jgi:hypothetical protein